ncbi:MAG TPA: penicillin-binding protein 1B [Gammaproteobacteria bacterium]|nr:penicillin-binding protein 1B [Gammaproteobacteria bacterium]
MAEADDTPIRGMLASALAKGLFAAKHLAIWCLLAFVAYWAWLDHQVIGKFQQRRWDLPGRIYAAPMELYAGLRATPAQVVEMLGVLGYRRVQEPAGAGQFRQEGSRILVRTRGFVFWDGAEAPQAADIRFTGGRIGAIARAGGGEIGVLRFDPPEIGRLHATTFEDRLLLSAAELPAFFTRALIAVEDRRFEDHIGIDWLGILRAMWVNLTRGGIEQGASTLTQQLVKNLFLTRERTLTRKIKEAMMAISIERAYGKREIFETYVNEVFLGQDGNRAIHGFGLAAQFYFGRPLAELGIAEQALLIGMIRGPSLFNPFKYPERAIARRNEVLQRLAASGLLTQAQVEGLRKTPLMLREGAWRGRAHYAAFLDLLRRQLKREYREEDLQTAGLKIFTTLDVRVQLAAEKAVADGIAALEKARPASKNQLQAALIVTDPQSGDIKALIGDRRGAAGGFNRALDAKRQIGSLMKPFVYMTALARPQQFNVLTSLEDEPRTYTTPNGKLWTPQNYDRQFHGAVPLQDALAKSLNLATLDLGFRLGIPAVASTLRKFGYAGATPNYPSLFLGAIDMTPYEVAQVYQAIANDGFRSPLRAIRAVVDTHNTPLQRYGLKIEHVVDAPTAFLTRYLLTRVVERGTARSLAAALPDALPLAGKTGTSDDARDSWFVGFGGDLLGVAWVGRDDNKSAGLTGATGALRIWTDTMKASGISPVNMEPPPNVEWHRLTADGRALAAAACPGAVMVPVNVDFLPQTVESCAPPPSPGLWSTIKEYLP